MICNNCGSNNKDNNKFCITCGVELFHHENSNRIYCSKCGFDNIVQSKYCVSCGNNLKNEQGKVHQPPHKPFRNKKQKIKEKRNISGHTHHSFKRKNSKILWISVAVVFGSILIASSFELLFMPKEEEIPVELKSTNAIVESKVFEIASKFVCSCGSCNEEPLEVCKCARAVEERQFIRDYLEQNQKPDDIVLSVANKYGWLEVEFASSYEVDASKVWNPNKLLLTEESINSNLSTLEEKATFSDKYIIYSSFNCPCGRCELDELKDCNCNHSGGAKEIKSFIDEKIGESKYTVNEITEMVSTKYGGKKN